MPDAGYPKPCGEFLVSGSFFSPDAQAVPGGEVSVTVGDRNKKLYVFGPRQWLMGIPSEPDPVSEVEEACGKGGGREDPDEGALRHRSDARRF